MTKEEIDKKKSELDELETTISLGEREYYLRQKKLSLAKKLKNENTSRRLYEAYHGPLPPEMAEDCDVEEDTTVTLSQEIFPEVWRLVERRMAALDKRWAALNEREAKQEYIMKLHCQCETFIKALKRGTDVECCGPAIFHVDSESTGYGSTQYTIQLIQEKIKFCPWCGKPVNPNLKIPKNVWADDDD